MNTKKDCCGLCSVVENGALVNRVNDHVCSCHSKKEECEHDLENTVRKGRAKLHCRLCDEDITLLCVFAYEAMHPKKETLEEWKARYNSPDYKSDFDRFCEGKESSENNLLDRNNLDFAENKENKGSNTEQPTSFTEKNKECVDTPRSAQNNDDFVGIE